MKAAHAPWLKWYPADWRADPRLRDCSLAARGLWVELLGLMHEADPYGHLIIAGNAPTPQKLATHVGATVAAVRSALDELERSGVFSRNPDGVIYSRRMVRDREKAERDRLNGKGGGNPSLKPPVNEGVNPPDNREDKAQRPEARGQKLQRQGQEQSGAVAASPPTTRRKSRLPDGWALPKAWGEWAQAERGWPADEVRRVAALFADHWRGKGEARADWLATWRNWVRRETTRDGPRSDAKTESRNAFAASILGDVGHDQQTADHSDPRDISGEAVRVA